MSKTTIIVIGFIASILIAFNVQKFESKCDVEYFTCMEDKHGPNDFKTKMKCQLQKSFCEKNR